tara:strand:+ start:79 stop:336 length:258 start_codon:yes stop_codon:yes gene_type:complete
MKHYTDSKNEIWAYEDDGSQDHLIPDDFTLITNDEADALRLYDKTYADLREENYPSIPDQLDDIYHNGLDAWKATIKVTKDKYPK